MTPATEAKRDQLKAYISRVLQPEPSVKAVIGIGSIATGHMQSDSDIDAVIFLDPLDLYIAPAEAIWRPDDDTYHSIFDDVAGGIEFDFDRLAWQQWADPDFVWSEGHRADLSSGWIAYDPAGEAAQLISRRTAYSEEERLARLDEAITWLDQHLGDDKPEKVWDSLGPAIAHDRLEAAYHNLIQGLFAYNRRWQTWRNRELQALLRLPWLPEGFQERVLVAANAPALDHAGYQARVEMLRALTNEFMVQLVDNGDYSSAVVDQAFIRSHEETGRSWNIEEWTKFHQARHLTNNDEMRPSHNG